MLLRRRRLLFLSGLCIFVVFQLHRTINSSPSLSPSNIRSPEIHGQITEKKSTDLKEIERKESPKKEISISNEEQQKLDMETAQKFHNRLKAMKSRCPGWEKSPFKKHWVVNKNFLINYPRKILVCAVPKAGSTSWHMTLWGMRRMQAGLDPDIRFYTYNDTVENHHMVERLTANQGISLITYNKGDDDVYANPPTEKARRLLLTRHPFARMISGWHQKFLPESSYAELLFSRYPKLKKYVRNTDPNHKMAWKDFAEFVADTGTRPQPLDYHFTPTWEICKPCDYAFTYILKAESVDQDEPWLRRRLNITDIDIGRRGIPPGGSLVNDNPSENIKKYMLELDDNVRRRLYNVYKEDFLMFGYTFDFKTLQSGGFE